jgi:hypothetical protein
LFRLASATHRAVDIVCLPRSICIGQVIVCHKVDVVLVQELGCDHPGRIWDDLIHPPKAEQKVGRGGQGKNIQCRV